ANLLLTRTAERSREFALRAAIGAGRGRIVRQVIHENLVLALIGGGVGLLVAFGLLRAIVPLGSGVIPRLQESELDARVLEYSVLLSVLTSLLFSLAPAARLRGDLRGTSTGKLGAGLVAVQIALGLMLASGASLLTGSFLHLMRRDLGFQPERLLSFGISLPPATYSRARQLDFH